MKEGDDMGEIRDNIRRNLAYYLSIKNISQKEFAEKLGVSQSSVTCWIKGKNSPDIEMVAQICDVLGVSVIDLFGTDGSDRYSAQEKKIINQYRKKTEFQKAVNVLLGVGDKAGD